MADFRQLLQDIKKKKFAPVYILMGQESFYIDKVAEALEKNVVNDEEKEFDQSVLYGADSNIGMVLEAAGQFPMWSDKRLVILKEAQSMTRAKTQLDKLKTYISSPNPSTVLCIVYKDEALGSSSALIKSALKNKDVVVFDSPKIKDWKIGEIVRDYCNANKIHIEERAIQILIANVGTSLSNIISQLEKLQLAANGENNKITAALVIEQIGVSKEFNNFELTAALSKRDYFQTLHIFRNFEDNPKANPTIVTASTLFLFYQRLLIAAFNEDKSDKGLMEALRLKYPAALREIRTGLQYYNASQLVRAVSAIREFDTRSKGISSFQKEFPLMQELLLKLLTL